MRRYGGGSAGVGEGEETKRTDAGWANGVSLAVWERMNVYTLTRPAAPWGDYGSVLIYGMSMHLPRVAGLIQLERTGPFVPPITQPGLEIVVTDAFKARLEASGLTGFGFQPVLKRDIVQLEWERWDREAVSCLSIRGRGAGGIHPGPST